MYSYTHGLEFHVQASNDKRLADATKAQQIRMARAGRPSFSMLAMNRIRTSIGTMLISAGERLRQDPPPAASSTMKRPTAISV